MTLFVRTDHCRSLFRMGRFRLFCSLVFVLTGMPLANSNTLANETCRGPKGEKVDSGGDRVSDFC